jgi:hypothetical protein
MDSSGFRSSLNVQDRRDEQGTNALVSQALRDKLSDPATPDRERRVYAEQLRRLLPYEFDPDVGFQGGELTHAGLGSGQRHIGAPGAPPVSPIFAAMGLPQPEPFVNYAQDMRTEGLFGELSNMIQRPSSEPGPQDLAAALMRR